MWVRIGSSCCPRHFDCSSMQFFMNCIMSVSCEVGVSGMSTLGVGELPSSTGLARLTAIMASCVRAEGSL